MSRVKQWLVEGVAAVAVSCLFLSCLAAGEQTSLGDLGVIVGPQPAPVCANVPPCYVMGSNNDVCGNTNGVGGQCDPLQVVCICVFNALGDCVCRN